MILLNKVRPSWLALPAACLLAACGNAPDKGVAANATTTETVVVLASDPIEQATQCQAAALAAAQSRPDFSATGITEAEFERVLQPAYLGATGSGELDKVAMQKISDRATAQARDWRGGKAYLPILEQCGEKLPMTRPGSFKGLPPDAAEARGICLSLAAALVETYGQTEGANRDSIPRYGALIDALQEEVIRDRWKAGDTDETAMQSSLRKALARAVRLGPPGDVMRGCLKRFAS